MLAAVYKSINLGKVGERMVDISTEKLEELENEVTSQNTKLKKMEEFVSPDKLYQELIQSVRKYHPSADISLIEKAYRVARESHEGQVRKSGEPYIIHPLCVAIILADLELDKETIVAGLLHDVVEDTVMTEEEIAKEFNPDVALLVDGVTKLAQLSYDQISRPSAQYAYLKIYDTGEAEGKGKRDHGYLCSDCPATRYF